MTTQGRQDWGKATVLTTREIAIGIREISLQRQGLAPAAPGSHIDVRLTLGNQTLTRSYSVVESDVSHRELTISVLRTLDSHGGSALMHSLKPGDSIEMTQPLQNFPLRPGAPTYLLVAGGIGITAIMPMASGLRLVGAEYALFYTGRSQDRMAYVERLEAEHGDRLHLAVSDEGTRLDPAEVIARVCGDPNRDLAEAYVCGPTRLLDAVHSEWVLAGLPAPNLRFETFGGGGTRSAEAFQLIVPQLALDTRVAADESLLAALLRIGVPTMYDCLKGECGLCVLDVLRVDGTLDHRDVFLSPEQKACAATITTCVSRVTASQGGEASVLLGLP